jgi:hypothetical protein
LIELNGIEFSLIVAMIGDYYMLRKGIENEKRANEQMKAISRGESVAKQSELQKTLNDIRDRRWMLFWSFVKNIFDLPTAYEGIFPTSVFGSGVLGWTGLISSLAGWYLIWPSPSK